MSKKLPKIDEYRRLALEATAHAQASGLDRVREIHEQAAARWSALALREEGIGQDARPPLILIPMEPEQRLVR